MTSDKRQMTQLSPQPRIRLSKLRDIGWRLWDPIGLLRAEGLSPGNWDDEANLGFADEYDAYLISAASQLRQGVPGDQVADYLVQMECDYMALPRGPTTRERAEAVVAALLADQSIWTWPDEQGKFSQSD